jgi:hypothetical protein
MGFGKVDAMARRIRSKQHHLWAARDGRRAVLAAVLLIFVAATSLSDGKLIPDFTGDASSIGARTVTADEPDDDLRTGSILITPADGNLCEHRLIDNQTWRIRPNGIVQCDAAVTWQPQRNGEYTAITRIEAIRDGFVSKR